MIAQFCQQGADINYVITDNRQLHGFGPLTIALVQKNEELALMLLKWGANPNGVIQCQNHPLANFSPLCLAALVGLANLIIPLCEKGGQVNCKITNNYGGWNGFHPLEIAIAQHHLPMITELIKCRADVNAIIDQQGYFTNFTPLCLAAYLGYEQAVELLCKNGALVEYVIHDNHLLPNGFTPLFIAVEKDQLQIVKILVNFKASIERSIQDPASKWHNYTP